VGAGDDEFADELGERREDVEDQAPARGRGVERLVQGLEAGPALAELGDHVDEVLERAAVPAEAGHHEGVAGIAAEQRRRLPRIGAAASVAFRGSGAQSCWSGTTCAFT
jgi:hypothetical protein